MSFLDTDLLARIHERAADADAANTYPEADLADLREAGYLAAFVPTEFGGAGLSLTEIAAEQTALAKAAPGTALGINMHQIIVGLGRYLVAADRPEEIGILTSNYHIFRARLTAERWGLENVYGISADSDPVLFVHLCVREWASIIKDRLMGNM